MEVLKQILGEMIALAFLLVPFWLYAIYREKNARKYEPKDEISKQEYDKNLQNLAEILGAKFQNGAENFSRFLDELAMQGSDKIVGFGKFVSEIDFIGALNAANFKPEFAELNFTDKPADQAFIAKSAANLKEPLALGVYLADEKFYTFLCDQDELFKIANIAAALGENIIICD